jgi:hypothetical protein
VTIFSRLILCLFVALCLPCYAQTGPPDTERDKLTFAVLMDEEAALESPMHNGYFMPVEPVAAAKHVLSTILIIPETEGWSFGTFPGASVQMFTSGGRLIPVNRDIIRAGNSYGWNITFSPGRTWSEPGDNGLSRASFPFVLTKKWPESAHNGLATFLFDDKTVSPLVVQFSSKFNNLDAWGRLPISLIRGKIKDRDRVEAEYLLQMEQRLPTRPLTELAAKFGSWGLETLRLWPESENESVSGVVFDSVLYVGDCPTRFGPYPYCDEMRHSVYSMSKSLDNLIAILRLAHKYGDQVFDLKINDYVNENVWDEATFADALNMTVAREFIYSDVFANMLVMAMDSFLKSREGPDAGIWDMMLEEVLRPIGVFHSPIVPTYKSDWNRGVPVLSEGIFPTYHDIAKIALLLQNGGRYHGEQLLSVGKIREALYQTKIRGAPAPNSHNAKVSYYMSLWQVPTELDKCTVNVSMMSGVGGKIAVLLPSGAVAFYVRNSKGKNFVRELTVAVNSLRSECQ